MPSARSLAAARRDEAATSKAASIEKALTAIVEAEGRELRLCCPGDLEIKVRYDGLEPTASGAAPSFAIYLYSSQDWLSVGEQTLRNYLGMYGPWEVRDE